MNMTRRGFLKLLALTPVAVAVASLPSVVRVAEALPIVGEPFNLVPAIESLANYQVKTLKSGIIFDFGDFELIASDVGIVTPRTIAFNPTLFGVAVPQKESYSLTMDLGINYMTMDQYDKISDRFMRQVNYSDGFNPGGYQSVVSNVNILYQENGKRELIAISRSAFISSIQIEGPMDNLDGWDGTSMRANVKITSDYVEYLGESA